MKNLFAVMSELQKRFSTSRQKKIYYRFGSDNVVLVRKIKNEIVIGVDVAMNEWNAIVCSWAFTLPPRFAEYDVKLIDIHNAHYLVGQNGWVVSAYDADANKFKHYTDKQSSFLSNKVNCADCLDKEAVSIYPETHIVDSSLVDLEQFDSTKKWILKLEDGSSGKDVHIINKPSDLAVMHTKSVGKRWVLQEYITNPKLLRGKFKFHLRSHSLLMNDKVKVFDTCDVLAATHEYNYTDFNDLQAHITNVSVNKHESNHSTYISSEFPDIHALMPDVYKLIKKSLIAPSSKYDRIDYSGYTPFLVLAHDILIDDNNKLWLLEVNCGPGMYDIKQMTPIYEQHIKRFLTGLFSNIVDGCKCADASFVTLDMTLPEDYVYF